MKTESTDLGFHCPACGGTKYHYVQDLWNVWECHECGVWSAIRDSQMEIYAKATIDSGMRTESDLIVDKEAPTELPWDVVNRNMCNLLHRELK